jgi:hypothetical protein
MGHDRSTPMRLMINAARVHYNRPDEEGNGDEHKKKKGN